MVPRTSAVTVLVIVWTEIGASPPTSTAPTRIFRERRQNHAPVAKERRARGVGAAMLGAGNRMAGDELRELRAERAPRGADHVALGAAGVADDASRRQRSRQGGKDRWHLRDGRRDQHQVRVARGGAGIGGDGVDQAAVSRELQVLAAAPGAGDLRHLACRLQRRGERAADQADADHGELHRLLKVARRAARRISRAGWPRAPPGSARSPRACRR